MNRRTIVLGGLALLIAAASVNANVVALKRSGGVTDGRGLASVFTNAVSGATVTVYNGAGMAADSFLYQSTTWAQSILYVNGGAISPAQSGAIILAKFNVGTLPGFAGGHVNTAELRFYATGGNSGMYNTGYVTFSDWSEGNKTGVVYGWGDYPGVAPATPGVSAAHPNGLNTGAYQTADGVYKDPNTYGYVGSWSGGQIFGMAKDGVTLVNGMAHNPWGIGLHPPYDQYLTIAVTPIVQLWANGTPNYGFFINNLNGNYGPYLSEETEGADLQPILFIDYQSHGNPNAVTNLAAGNPDWFKIDLTWTAPSANPPAAVASYDLRMSTSAITDDATFTAATRLTGVQTPAAPGTTEHFTATGLSPSTTYYFAIKSTDIIGTVSAISNIPVSATTLAMDVTPPAQITTLAAPNVKPNYATLTWTAVGDDGMTGLAAGYDMRYSTTAIVTDADFAAATPVTGLGTPKAPGSAETITIHGLTPSTQYWFAIKARDEVPNWSPLSNVVTFTTLAQDLLPPYTISNLAVSSTQIHGVFLTWTAPADQGSAGMAGYDIRCSTAAITDANFASATQVTGAPTPATPGNTELFPVTGLNPSTTYYFAIKAFDYAEPTNVSAISNVASATTMPPILPVTVHNPWLTNDRVADTHNITTMAATYVNAYTPDGVVTSSNPETRAINIYNNQKRRLYHWADQPPNVGGFIIEDPTYTQNVFGWALCGATRRWA